ncbi:MAG: TonB-dependent receptor [Candidatus Cloacimonetes bacterium]|nr:TonB-dependent receptor [Candidatus Cloacimonadota bacterium]
MSKIRSLIFLGVLFLFVGTSFLSAATTGKIAGRVTNAETGEPIAGANVIIEDEQMGAACDGNGRYIIINVPPGTYNVRAQLMGYQSVTKTDVTVNLGLTTTLNFELKQTDTQIEGITVKSGGKNLVKQDITGSESVVTSESMENMAVENIQDVIAVTAGAVGSGQNMHIRGGRSNEVVYTIDGMSVSNPVDQGFGMDLDMSSVSDMNISTGGFTAEFGNAQSAIINLVTRSGGPQYSGQLKLRSDHLFGVPNNNYDEAKFSIGGPLFPKGSQEQRNKYTFFFNIKGAWNDGRYKDYYTIDEDNILYPLFFDPINDEPEQVEIINSVKGDREDFAGFDIGNRFNNNYQANIKMKFALSPKMRFTVATRGDRAVWLPFSYLNRYALEHYNHWEESHNQQAFTFDHTVSPKMFYKVRGSRFETDLKLNSGVDRDWYFSDENTTWSDPNWNINPTYNNFGVTRPGEDEQLRYTNQYGNENNVPMYASPGSHAGNFWDDQTTTYTLKGDLTYQINNIHEAKTGFEIKYNDIVKDRLSAPWEINDEKRLPNFLAGKDIDTTGMGISENEIEDVIIDSNWVAYNKKFYTADNFQKGIEFAGGAKDGYKARPWQGAYYIQDKMEWEGMIVNAGLRFDFWYLGDYYKVKSDSTGEYIDADWGSVQYIEEVGSDKYELKEEDVDKFQVMVSPRLGVSHPITLRDVLHFAYNYQSQLPPLQYVFTSSTPEVGTVGTNVGNPNLKPEITKTYEVGLEHQMGEDYTVDVTIFYKNIYNLVSSISNNFALLPDSLAQAGKQYYLYVSEDYGSARGVELTLAKRFSNFWGFNFGYTYSYAFGRNSSVHAARENLREYPLNWDVRHIANLQANFGIPENEEFYLFGMKMPDKFNTSFHYQIHSGEPYTPVSDNDQALDTNSKRMPYTSNADLKITKGFNIFKNLNLKLYFQVKNLFDKRNINYVNNQFASPDDPESWHVGGETQDNGTLTYWENYDLNENGKIDSNEDQEGAEYYMSALSNPNIYSQGRRYNFGISFDF